jgi:hypothetical protein
MRTALRFSGGSFRQSGGAPPQRRKRRLEKAGCALSLTHTAFGRLKFPQRYDKVIYMLI